MLKKLNPHCYSVVCTHCGERGTADIYSGLGISAGTREALACRDLIDRGWFNLLSSGTLCPACARKAIRGDFRG